MESETQGTIQCSYVLQILLEVMRKVKNEWVRVLARLWSVNVRRVGGRVAKTGYELPYSYCLR